MCQNETAPEYREKEYIPYDGWYNNRAHPEWGVVGKFLFSENNYIRGADSAHAET